jgi:hypothetical protein
LCKIITFLVLSIITKTIPFIIFIIKKTAQIGIKVIQKCSPFLIEGIKRIVGYCKQVPKIIKRSILNFVTFYNYLGEQDKKRGYRIWTSKDGKSQTTARFVGFLPDGKIQLERENQTTISVDPQLLCDDDRKFLQENKLK